MPTTEARPVISDEEFDERHELKDKFESLKMEKTMEAMTQKSSDASDQMTSLQCFDQARSVRHEAGNVPQVERVCLSAIPLFNGRMQLSRKEDISCIQDELKMPLEINAVANHASYVNLLGFTKGKAKDRVISNSIELSFETYRQIYQKGKNATKMNIVLKKAGSAQAQRGRH